MRGKLFFSIIFLLFVISNVSAQFNSGSTCQESSQCTSNNCQNSVCCLTGKVCCNYDSQCSPDYECGVSSYCIPKPITLEPDTIEVQFSPEQAQTPVYCSDGCIEQWVGDGVCDQVCNNAACEFDFGDCASQGLQENGGECSQSEDCATGNCNNGLCCPIGQICCSQASDCPNGESCNQLNFCQSSPREECSPNCVVDWLGDGECQIECIGCDFDGGDCLRRGGPDLSPADDGISSCGFQGELETYGRCVFTVLGKTETIPGLGLVSLQPYCGVAEKFTASLTKDDATDKQIIDSTQETINSLLKLTDTRLALSKYADIIECFDSINAISQRNLKKSLDSAAASYYTQTRSTSTMLISDTNVDILVINDGKKFGVDENNYLYKDLAGTAYKDLQNSKIKFVIIPDLRVAGNVYEASGVTMGETTFTIIQARRASKDYIEFTKIKTTPDSLFRIEGNYLESDYNGDGVFEQINIRPAIIEEERLSLFSKEELIKYIVPALIILIFVGILFLIKYIKSKKN